MKYYSDGGDFVYDAGHWVDEACDRQESIIVELMQREKGGEYKWCRLQNAFIDPSDECGMQCHDYDPRNGKSGCCRELSQGFIGTGKWYEITGGGKIIQKASPASQFSDTTN